MADFSPRGYKNPSTPGEINDPTFWATVGRNQDARWLEIKEDSEGALANSEAALGTLNAVRELAKQSESASEQSAFHAYSANQTVTAYEPRIAGIEAMAGLTPEEPTDGQTSTLISNEATLTNAAVGAAVAAHVGTDGSGAQEAVITQAVEATAIRTDKGFMTLQLAVDACQAGDTLQIRQTWTINAPVTVNKALTIQSARGGKVTTTGDVHAFIATASGVTFDKATIVGSGPATAGLQAAIRAVGTATTPITNLTVRDCDISGFRQYGIEGWHVTDFEFARNRIEDIGYAGIMVLSAQRGRITSNDIRNMVQPSPRVNSYGIAMSRDGGKTLEESPRSSDIVVFDNTVDGVPLWEGIDTHGGERLQILENRIFNTRVGVALVPGVNPSGVDTYAPRSIKVIGNIIDSTVQDGSRRQGVQVVGCATDVDNVVEYASALVKDNTITGHGTQNTNVQSGILLQVTRGSVVRGNELYECSPNAVHASHNNQGAIIENNLMVDTWTTDNAFTSCVYVSSLHQSLTIRGNIATRSTKTATKVNDRGLNLSAALAYPDVAIQYGDNGFSSCTLPIIDSPSTQNITEQRVEARRVSFYPGVPPLARQSVSGSRGGNAALSDLITKLANAGIISNSTTA